MLRKVASLLSPREKKLGALVLVFASLSGLVEALGVVSIAPFLSVLGSSNTSTNFFWVSDILENAFAIRVDSRNDLLVLFGMLSFCAVLVSAILRSLTYYFINVYVENLRHCVSVRLLEAYLSKPYIFFTRCNSDELSKTILSEVGGFANFVVRPLINMFAYTVVLIAIFGLLLAYDPVVAVCVLGVLGGIYLAIYLLVRRSLLLFGSTLVSADRERFVTCGEVFGGIKQLKMMDAEQTYLARFVNPSKAFAHAQSVYQTVSQVPKQIVEALAFGVLVGLVIFFILSPGSSSGSLETLLPVVGLYGFAAYRVQPALQSIFQGFTAMRYGNKMLDNIYAEFSGTIKKNDNEANKASSLIEFTDALRFDRVEYSYNESAGKVIRFHDVEILAGQLVGIVGRTGSGKTTFIDLLAGLIQPRSGRICVDDRSLLGSNIRGWQSLLGYVPQEIFLVDGSIAENVALSVPKRSIDMSRVEFCSRVAQLDSFIETLNEGYDSEVGQRGVRLSGGQKQRIGIARALYRDPQVLIFDEATSALDTLTERAILQSIKGLTPNITVVMISHRPEAVKNCDNIIVIGDGEKVAQGHHDQLLRESDLYRSIVSGSVI